MKKSTTKLCALLLSMLTLTSMVTLSNLTVFAAESDTAQNEIQSVSTAEDEEISFYGATGDRTLEDPQNYDSVTVLDSPDEYYSIISENDDSYNSLAAASSYPSSVDNSTSEFFPEVGNQGSIGSCTCWAQTYYQFTYAMNKSMGQAATTSGSFSPKWIYNLINGGQDHGSTYIDAYNIMKTQGNAPMSLVPYDSDYLSWSPVENIWEEALNYRVKSYQLLSFGTGNTPITGPDDADLNTIKAALNNNELLTYSTYVYSWNYEKIESNSDAPGNDNYVGQYIVTSMTGSSGSHRMTIVGYNDNIWVDINGNNIVEENEMGAFKIVNSWGKNYRNGGFSWVSYDALNKVSSVEGVAQSSNRSSIFRYVSRIDVEPYDSDSNIVLKYTLNSAARNQTLVTVKAEKDGNIYSSKVVPYNYSLATYSANSYSYDGTTNANDGTMVFDLSNVVPGITSENLNDYTWSVTFSDTKNDDNVFTVKNAKIVDANTGKTYEPSDVFPFSLNNNEKTVKFNNEDLNQTVIYYKGYDTPYIYYRVGNGNWTDAPGCAMTETDELSGYTHKFTIDLGEETHADVCFNDGNGNWDTVYGYYHTFEAGTYTYSNGLINPYYENGLTIYYNGYDTPYIHYQIGSGDWTDAPGYAMTSTNELSGYTHKFTIDLGDETYANVCFNDGNGNWDTSYGEYHTFGTGIYTYSNGNIIKIS